MSPKPDVSEERTEQILEAALKVFAEHGMEKARMEDIGTEAGLSKATLYLYFKTKDALVAAIMRRMFGLMWRGFGGLDAGDVPVKEYLRGFAASMVAEIKHLRPLLPLLYEFYALGLRKKAAREVLGEFVGKAITVFTPIIQEGIDRGELRAVNAGQVAITLLAMLEGTLLWAYAPERVDMETQIMAGTDLLLNSL